MDLFDSEKNGLAEIEDIRRVLSTYSKMEESELHHFLKLNTMN